MRGDLARWLLTPLSGSVHHELPLWTAWHGRFMVAAWAIALPLGVLVARYFKVSTGPQDDVARVARGLSRPLSRVWLDWQCSAWLL